MLAIARSDGLLALHRQDGEALDKLQALGLAPAALAFSARGTPRPLLLRKCAREPASRAAATT